MVVQLTKVNNMPLFIKLAKKIWVEERTDSSIDLCLSLQEFLLPLYYHSKKIKVDGVVALSYNGVVVLGSGKSVALDYVES